MNCSACNRRNQSVPATVVECPCWRGPLYFQAAANNPSFDDGRNDGWGIMVVASVQKERRIYEANHLAFGDRQALLAMPPPSYSEVE
jgi:hypothetical protein